jgi:DNA-binding XRE family transcriptional regulator
VTTIKLKVGGSGHVTLAHPLASPGRQGGRSRARVVAVDGVPAGVSADAVLRRYAETVDVHHDRDAVAWEEIGPGKILRPARARRDEAGIPSPEDLGGRVRAAREAAGLTQAQAASRLGVGATTYAEREKSTTLPYPMLLDLIRVLGYDPAVLCPEVSGPGPGG